MLSWQDKIFNCLFKCFLDFIKQIKAYKFYCSILHYLKDFMKMMRLLFMKNNKTNFYTKCLSYKMLKITTVVIFLENMINVFAGLFAYIFHKSWKPWCALNLYENFSSSNPMWWFLLIGFGHVRRKISKSAFLSHKIIREYFHLIKE